MLDRPDSPRTRRLLLGLGLGLGLALGGAARPAHAAAAAPPPASPAPTAPATALPTAEDWRQIETLLQRFGQAMLAEDEAPMLELLSPTLTETARAEIVASMRREFAATRWLSFAFTEPAPRGFAPPADLLPPGDSAERRLNLTLVARYTYQSRTPPPPPATAGTSAPPPVVEEPGRAVRLGLERVAGRWGIAGCDLFAVLGRTGEVRRAWNRYLWYALWLTLGVVFWLGMVIDCAVRYRRWRYTLAVLLLPPLGPLVYLCVGWRRKKIRETL